MNRWNIELERAYRGGWNAAVYGWRKSNNPHGNNADLEKAWSLGWRQSTKAASTETMPQIDEKVS
jgi:hypothetical protein